MDEIEKTKLSIQRYIHRLDLLEADLTDLVNHLQKLLRIMKLLNDLDMRLQS